MKTSAYQRGFSDGYTGLQSQVQYEEGIGDKTAYAHGHKVGRETLEQKKDL